MDLERNIKLLGTPERAQVLLAAMQSQLLGDSRVANTLIPRVCNAVLAAPSSTRHVSASLPAGCMRVCSWMLAAGGRSSSRMRVSAAVPAVLPCLPISSLHPPSRLQLLVKWWAEYPAELLESRVVRPLQKYLTDELYATKKLTIRWGKGPGSWRAELGVVDWVGDQLLFAAGPSECSPSPNKPGRLLP